MLRPLTRIALVLALLCVGRATAGAELGPAELVEQANGGVVVVDRALGGADHDGSTAEPVVVEWLTPGPHPPLPAGSLGGSCVPSRALLRRWVESHPQHPGRATWLQMLKDGRTRQVVFVGVTDGAPRAVCEAEILSGRSFAQHPEHAAWRAEVQRLSAARMPTPSPSNATPTTKTAPLSTVEQGVIRPTPPPPAIGCW